MKNILFLLLLFVFISCDKSNEMFIVDVSINIKVIDQNGNDLLNQESEVSINTDLIRLFTIEDDGLVQVNNSNLTNPKGYFVYENTKNEFVLAILTEIENNNRSMIIAWDDNDMDTLKYEIEERENSVHCSKVWLNDVLMWEPDGTSREFTIVK